MTESTSTVLLGLPGDNPLGFLAALGAQVALADQSSEHSLRWTEDPIPHPALSPVCEPTDIACAVRAVARAWLEGPVLDESFDPSAKLKLKPAQIRDYLRRGRDARSSGLLSACLLAENSLDNSGSAKPSDLYFTAGQQKFVSMARKILGEVTEEEIVEDITSPWRYHSHKESLMWDSVDDRLHALSAADPTKSLNPKLINPGAEALALIGLSRYPCFASPDRTLTQGCSGIWKRGWFVWPLWTVPATRWAVASLLAQVGAPALAKTAHRAEWYRSWGLSQVMQSQIRRSAQGGYGTFGPASVVWQRE